MKLTSSTCRLGQSAEVTIDAIPKKTFKAVVTEIGNNAIVRSTGVSTSQQTSASQEAKDFKVVVTLQDPPENLRPGLSATAKITTATRSSVLTIPIQALTVRTRADLKASRREKDSVQAAAPQPDASNQTGDKEEVQGVFVIRDRKAEFLPVRNRHHRHHRYRSAEGLESRVTKSLPAVTKCCDAAAGH